MRILSVYQLLLSRRMEWRLRYLKVLFLLAIIFSAFGLLAPGNGARATLFPERYQLGHSIYNSILQVARFSIAWVSTPLLLISTLMMIYLDIDRNFIFSKRVKVHPFLTSTILLVIVFLSAFLLEVNAYKNTTTPSNPTIFM